MSDLTLNEIMDLTILIRKGENWGTGFLYMADPLDFWFLTAAHCVYNSSHLKGYIYDTTVEWLRYVRENKKEFRKIPPHSVIIKGQDMWRRHKKSDLAARFLLDIGFIQRNANFHKDIGGTLTSYYPVKFCPSIKLERLKTGLRVDYFGYDDENIDAENPLPQLKHRKGEIDHIDFETKILSVSGTAVGGFSGGPVFVREITETGFEGGIPHHSETFHFIGIMIAVSLPRKGLPRNEIKVASVPLIDELTEIQLPVSISTTRTEPISDKTRLRKITFVGLSKAGKTVLIKRLKGKENLETLPTMGMLMEVLKFGDIQLMTVDLAGQSFFQQILWEPFVSKASGVVFVFDSADRGTVESARKWLRHVIKWAPENSPILFLANKQDLAEAMSLDKIIQYLELEQVMTLKPKTFAFYPCSALTGEGVDEAWQWMLIMLHLHGSTREIQALIDDSLRASRTKFFKFKGVVQLRPNHPKM